MNTTKTISLTILFAGIVAMIFSGATNNAVSGQLVLNNDVKDFQQQLQANGGGSNLDYSDFIKFMQLMDYYESIFGSEYVTKVYKNYYDDDDDDNDHDDDDNDNKHHHHNKDWWKKNNNNNDHD